MLPDILRNGGSFQSHCDVTAILDQEITSNSTPKPLAFELIVHSKWLSTVSKCGNELAILKQLTDARAQTNLVLPLQELMSELRNLFGPFFLYMERRLLEMYASASRPEKKKLYLCFIWILLFLTGPDSEKVPITHQWSIENSSVCCSRTSVVSKTKSFLFIQQSICLNCMGGITRIPVYRFQKYFWYILNLLSKNFPIISRKMYLSLHHHTSAPSHSQTSCKFPKPEVHSHQGSFKILMLLKWGLITHRWPCFQSQTCTHYKIQK